VTVVVPGIDRGWDRRDAPRDPGRPEPETTPRDARRAALLDGLADAFAAAEAIAREEGAGKLTARLPLDQALPEALRAQVTRFARAMAGEDAPLRPVDLTDGCVQGVYRWDESTRPWSTYTIYPDRRRPSDAGREP
jgi:hypothetical protein